MIIVTITTIVNIIIIFYHEFGDKMIVYDPFWETLKKSGESTYTLINKHKISSATINRIRKNMGISTLTINDLCRILGCRVEDILLYIENENEQKL